MCFGKPMATGPRSMNVSTLDRTQPLTNSKITNDIDYAQGIGSAHLFGRLLVTKAPRSSDSPRDT